MTKFPPCEVTHKFELNDKIIAILDNHCFISFFQVNDMGVQRKIFIIESSLPFSKNMYEFCLWQIPKNRTGKYEQAVCLPYNSDPRKLGIWLKDNGINVTEDVWAALEANRLAIKMVMQYEN